MFVQLGSRIWPALVAGCLLGGPSLAQDAAPAGAAAESQELAKQMANPIASLVSVPFQYNWDGGIGDDDQTRFTLNIQPVLPLPISEDLNLIARWIMPIMSQPDYGFGPTSGTGDIVFSSFFSPAKPKRAIWGLGPVFNLPTTSDPFLGSGQWAAGPTLVVLKQFGPWTVGGLANHMWSFADNGSKLPNGDERGDLNATYVQPFLSYATKTGVTFNLSADALGNWEAESGQEWTVPINVAASKLARFGPFPFQIGVGSGYYAEAPDGGPQWKFRMVFTLILPQKK